MKRVFFYFKCLGLIASLSSQAFTVDRTVARLQVTPGQMNFLIRGNIPIPPGKGASLEADQLGGLGVQNADGVVVPAQLDVVSRRSTNEIEVVNISAKVSLPRRSLVNTTLSYNIKRIRFDSLAEKQSYGAASFALSTKISALLNQNAVKLSFFDVHNHKYTAHLVAPTTGLVRMHDSGKNSYILETFSVATPDVPVTGAEGTLPHFLQVHAFWKFFSGEDYVQLDLRISNAPTQRDQLSDRFPPDPLDDRLGDIYYKKAELSFPKTLRAVNQFQNPSWSSLYRESGNTVIYAIIKSLPYGKMHFFPFGKKISFHLGLAVPGKESLLKNSLDEKSLGFARPGKNEFGEILYSWFDGVSHAFGAQGLDLPLLNYINTTEESNKQKASYLDFFNAHKNGTPNTGAWPVVVGALGPFHPWGTQDGNAVGGTEIYQEDGALAAWLGKPESYLYYKLWHVMVSGRVNHLVESDGSPPNLNSYIYKGGNFGQYPDAQSPPPFWFESERAWIPFSHDGAYEVLWFAEEGTNAQAAYVNENNLNPPYEQALRGFGAVDTQHLIRWLTPLIVKVYLGNDPLAKSDLHFQADMSRLSGVLNTVRNSYGGYAQWFTRVGHFMEVLEYPGSGMFFGRADAWNIFAIVADAGTRDQAWRNMLRQDLPLTLELLERARVACTGNTLSSYNMPQTLNGEHYGRQSFEAAFQSNAWSAFKHRIVAGMDENLENRLGEIIRGNTEATIMEGYGWSDGAHAPFFKVAVSVYNPFNNPALLPHRTPYCPDTMPQTNAGQGAQSFEFWSEFAVGARDTGNPAFFERAVEFGGGLAGLKVKLEGKNPWNGNVLNYDHNLQNKAAFISYIQRTKACTDVEVKQYFKCKNEQ